MRTTVKQLESAVTRYAELTGKNYILRHRDSRVGGYGVCTQDKTNYSQGNDIICGKASEVYNELWAAIRAIEEYQEIKRGRRQLPEILVFVQGGVVHEVYTKGQALYRVIDESNLDAYYHEGMTTNEIRRKAIIEETTLCPTDVSLQDFSLIAIANKFYPPAQ